MRAMAFDEDLANRIRELVGDEANISEQRMFGGLAFLVGGHMAVAASGQGGLLVRLDPSAADALLASTSATPMVMRGRRCRGWVRIADAELRTRRQLATWVERGITYARSLPPKPKPKPKSTSRRI